jgi:hypothetical protein
VVINNGNNQGCGSGSGSPDPYWGREGIKDDSRKPLVFFLYLLFSIKIETSRQTDVFLSCLPVLPSTYASSELNVFGLRKTGTG